jgi:hypothetical protein
LPACSWRAATSSAPSRCTSARWPSSSAAAGAFPPAPPTPTTTSGLIAQEEGDLRQALAHFKRTLLLNQICTPDHFGNIDERAAQHRQREHGAGGGRAGRAHGAEHMSIGGAFYALDRYRLRALVIDPSTVSGFLNSHARRTRAARTTSQTVEQAWDVVRVLLPEAVDGEQLEGTDGLGCIYLTASHVERAAARLARRERARTGGASSPASRRKFAELYWAATWQGAPRSWRPSWKA